MAIFKGAGVAIATPFFEDGSVNYDEFGRLIEFQIANGTDAIIVCGTTGESATLSEQEHIDVIRYCIDKVAKRIPVIAGTGSNSTETAVMLSKEAEEAGADGLLLVSPTTIKRRRKVLLSITRLLQMKSRSRSFSTTYPAAQAATFFRPPL